MRARSLLESFKFAGAGIWHALLTQKNMRTHLCLGALALAAGIAIGFEMLEMAILVLTISAVLTAELMNTSIETVVDLVTADQNEFSLGCFCSCLALSGSCDRHGGAVQ
jgi:diacylglycerol kinase